MKEKSMDKFLEDVSSSEKEREELQEIASLISNMQAEQPSSSFQTRLKEKLMEQANEQAAGNANSNSGQNKKHRFYWKRFRPLYAVAAAAAVILAFVVFFTDGPQNWGSGTADPDKPPSERIIAIRNFARLPQISSSNEAETRKTEDDEIDAVEQETNTETERDRSNEISEKDQKPGEEKPAREQDATGDDRDQIGEERIGDDETPSKQDDPDKAKDPDTDKVDETDKPETDPDEESDPLNPEPEFDIWEKEQSVRVAGVVDLPEIKYGEKAIEEQEPVGSIDYSWRPGMIVEASVSSIGTTEWARKLLADEGFTVGTNDTLEITEQKTQKGTFLEIVHAPPRSSSLPMVVYYQEDRGIIGYYYEEKGSALQAGYYPILSPSKAFEQIKDVPVYSEYKRLDFSFRKVSLEYHEFVIVRNGEQRLTKLPAYRFTGMEVTRGGGEINIYLPAVSIP